MLSKLEQFIKRLRWKAFFFDKKSETDNTSEQVDSYGFKTEKSPPQHKDLLAFENDLYQLIRNLKFRKLFNTFQDKLSHDVKNINSSTRMLVPADKTTNLYKVEVDDYRKLLKDNIVANYQKTNDGIVSSIDNEAKQIAHSLKLDDRIERYTERKAFITLKDHKTNFANNPKCRLINPAKSEIGKISKSHLDRINRTIRSNTNLCQWRNTSAVIEWFNALPQKRNSKFIKFDVVEFYPSITEELFKKAIDFAQRYVTIEQNVIDCLLHCRKSILFNEEATWVKSGGNLFDVTMGSYDGAEVCELVGLFLLNDLKAVVPQDIGSVGLYRDDGLAALHECSGPDIDRIKKNIIKTFQAHGLRVTTEANLLQTDFLDVTFSLKSAKYWPYHKPGDQPLYIDTGSNHPPNIKRQIPAMVGARLSHNSCDNDEFRKAAPIYEEALRKSGYTTPLCYINKTQAGKKKKRGRNIVWFNPPYNSNVSTNVGKEFFKLLDKHFPSHHRLHKICNRNNIKMSYCCMPNINAIITGHNMKLLKAENATSDTVAKSCNCRNKANCPLNGNCCVSSVVYKASITSNGEVKHYYGCCETSFKTRYSNHLQSFKNPQKKNATELSKTYWKLKEEEGNPPNINWSIVRLAVPYKCGSRRCNLCLEEKLAILQAEPSTTLNKRSELIAKCRHSNKFKIKNVR